MVEKFIDKWGLLDKHYYPDGGDSGHREGLYWSLLAMMSPGKRLKYERAENSFYQKEYNEVMKKIHPSNGVILRHSNPKYDASDWDRMSRDQLQPHIIAAGYWSPEKELKRLFKGHLKRGLLFANNTRRNGSTKKNHGKLVAGEVRDYGWKMPDLTGPDIWGNFIRAFDYKILWPLLFITDIEMFLGSIIWRYKKDNITLNHTLSLLQAMDTMPTIWTWLSKKIMPVERLIKLAGEHLRDFPDDMVFFEDMFKDAHRNIK
ncbi:MAG: hypothetical protein COB41_00630 [Proteobacteria bacterium]|nr:MAG: hypothetical protein COB41_00015 [Pseudomonadota bacterium]PCI45928.1 MAG: hypothetical protein COB41_00630 [Pseudomonadota bacterium]